jgi:hypothetical protein
LCFGDLIADQRQLSKYRDEVEVSDVPDSECLRIWAAVMVNMVGQGVSDFDLRVWLWE